MTAPLTPEEREKTVAFIRETLAREPDAPPLRSLRFLLAELDRIRNLPREGDLEAIRDTERELERVKAERDEERREVDRLRELGARLEDHVPPTLDAALRERDAALAALAEATAPLGNQAQNFARVVGERNAALAELKKVKAERDNYRLNHDALGKSYDHAIEDKDAALAEAKALREALKPIVLLVKDYAYKAPEQVSLRDFLQAMGRLGAAAEAALAAHPEPALTADEVVRLHEEGTELRKEIERRLAPMKQGPFEPPEPKR